MINEKRTSKNTRLMYIKVLWLHFINNSISLKKKTPLRSENQINFFHICSLIINNNNNNNNKAIASLTYIHFAKIPISLKIHFRDVKKIR